MGSRLVSYKWIFKCEDGNPETSKKNLRQNLWLDVLLKEKELIK